MLLAFAALEAYLNYLGPELCPDAWVDEKATFSSGKYRGTLGKLALLLERCELDVDRGREPWQTLKELNTRRDKLMHPRSEEWDRSVEFADPSEIRRIDPEFFALVDDAFLDKAMSSIEAVCSPLHSAAREIIGDGPALGPSAFRGMVGHQGGSLLD